MRTESGTGNIYFDDVFVNGVPWYSWLFYGINACMSMINLVGLPVIFYGCYINSGYHRNYRLVSINVYFSFFLSSSGNFVYSLLVLSRASDKEHDIIYYTFRFGMSFGAALWRVAFLTIAIERTAATIFNKIYEKHGPLWLPLTLLIFALMLAAVIPLSYFVVRARYFVVVGTIAAIDFACLLSVSLLFWSNKTMRKLKMITHIVLSQRYQITENLRILHIVLPLIIVGTAFDFLGLIAASLQGMFDFTTQLYYPLYYIINTFYISIALCLLFEYNIRARRKITTFLCNKKSANVVPEIVHIKNVDGELLVISETPDIHFNQLSLFWK